MDNNVFINWVKQQHIYSVNRLLISLVYPNKNCIKVISKFRNFKKALQDTVIQLS